MAWRWPVSSPSASTTAPVASGARMVPEGSISATRSMSRSPCANISVMDRSFFRVCKDTLLLKPKLYRSGSKQCEEESMPQIGARLGGSHVLLQQPCSPTPIESPSTFFWRLLWRGLARSPHWRRTVTVDANHVRVPARAAPLPSQHWLTAALSLAGPRMALCAGARRFAYAATSCLDPRQQGVPATTMERQRSSSVTQL